MSTTETNYPDFLRPIDIKYIEGTANHNGSEDPLETAEEFLNMASDKHNKLYNSLTGKEYHNMTKEQVFLHSKDIVSKGCKEYKEFFGDPFSVMACKRIATYLYMERVSEYNFRVFGK